jgi:hypothetical protein
MTRRSLLMREPSRPWRRLPWFLVTYLLVVYLALRFGTPNPPSTGVGWAD